MLKILRPLPQSLQGHACSQCGKTCAVWSLPSNNAEQLTICSVCVLYDSSVWGDSARSMISDIEVSRGRMFDRDESAKLVRCKDADDVVGALVLLTRVASLGAGSHR